MKTMIQVVLLASALAASSAGAAEMNLNPLGLPASSQPSETKGNVYELRVESGSANDLFGHGSGHALSGVFDGMVSDALSVGVQLLYASNKFSAYEGYESEYGLKVSNMGLAGRVAYHLGEVIDNERLDVYGGGSLGFSQFSVSAYGPGVEEPLAKMGFVTAGGFAGGRFWFTRNLGANAEVGYTQAIYNAIGFPGFSWSTASVGLSFRF
jgi:hypothetical protein